MADIPSEILSRLCCVLLDCGPFASDSALRAIFSDARISPWRNKLPQAGSPDERVQLIVDFLRIRYTATQENVLLLLLYVLRDQVSPEDACHQELTELATQLEDYFKIKTQSEAEDGLVLHPTESQEPTPHTSFIVTVTGQGEVGQVFNIERLEGGLTIGKWK